MSYNLWKGYEDEYVVITRYWFTFKVDDAKDNVNAKLYTFYPIFLKLNTTRWYLKSRYFKSKLNNISRSREEEMATRKWMLYLIRLYLMLPNKSRILSNGYNIIYGILLWMDIFIGK